MYASVSMDAKCSEEANGLAKLDYLAFAIGRTCESPLSIGYTGVVTQLDRTTVYSRERERIQLEVYVTMKSTLGIVSVYQFVQSQQGIRLRVQRSMHVRLGCRLKRLQPEMRDLQRNCGQRQTQHGTFVMMACVREEANRLSQIVNYVTRSREYLSKSCGYITYDISYH